MNQTIDIKDLCIGSIVYAHYFGVNNLPILSKVVLIKGDRNKSVEVKHIDPNYPSLTVNYGTFFGLNEICPLPIIPEYLFKMGGKQAVNSQAIIMFDTEDRGKCCLYQHEKEWYIKSGFVMVGKAESIHHLQATVWQVWRVWLTFNDVK